MWILIAILVLIAIGLILDRAVAAPPSRGRMAFNAVCASRSVWKRRGGKHA